MTEHESQEFYDNLRQKLQDHGSAPPESVWAGIRQQVPARRRRWWWRGAWLALLLVGAVATLLLKTPPKRFTRSAPAADSQRKGKATVAAAATEQPASTTTGPAHTPHPTPDGVYDGLTFAASWPPASSAAAKSAADKQPAGLGGLTRSLNSRAGNDRKLVAAGASAAKPRRATSAPDSVPGQQEGFAAGTEAGPAVRGLAARGKRRRLVLAASVSRRQPTRKSIAKSAARPTATERTGRPTATLISQPGQYPGRATLPPFAGMGEEVPVAFRPVLVQRLPVALPVIGKVAVDSVPVAPRFRRWAVDVLAGPGVAYRRLGPDSTTGNQLHQLERPALTYAGQVQFRYAFSPRLGASAGLGYTRFATKFNFVLRKQAADTLPITTEAIQRHDTYRYLALPLQVHYLLGQQGRWQYGVLGGGTLGVYLGGRTSMGTACACEQQRWTRAHGPYRMVNLSVTGGVEVRYQVAPGWQVLAQPAFQYSIQNINKPGTTGPARYPFATSLLTGISYDLR